jgi:hypothetical protein
MRVALVVAWLGIGVSCVRDSKAAHILRGNCEGESSSDPASFEAGATQPFNYVGTVSH